MKRRKIRLEGGKRCNDSADDEEESVDEEECDEEDSEEAIHQAMSKSVEAMDQ